jgi:hypothetical protein
MVGRPDLLNLRYRLNLILEWLGDGAYEVDGLIRDERRAA